MQTGLFVQMTKEAPVAIVFSLGQNWQQVESCFKKYRGITVVTSEIAWIQSLLIELCLSPSAPPLLWCDNQSVVHLAANPIFHAQAKHIELDLHFIRNKVLQNQLSIRYLLSFNQIIDIFTKHISSSRFF